ncbi:Histone-lysine N-methyltransferase SETMAR, partial [Habropoda laboriosa]
PPETSKKNLKMKKVMREMQIKRPSLVNRRGVLYLHNNARQCTSMATQTKILELQWKLIPHPRYFPDLVPTEFHIEDSYETLLYETLPAGPNIYHLQYANGSSSQSSCYASSEEFNKLRPRVKKKDVIHTISLVLSLTEISIVVYASFKNKATLPSQANSSYPKSLVTLKKLPQNATKDVPTENLKPSLGTFTVDQERHKDACSEFHNETSNPWLLSAVPLAISPLGGLLLVKERVLQARSQMVHTSHWDLGGELGVCGDWLEVEGGGKESKNTDMCLDIRKLVEGEGEGEGAKFAKV